jgi:short-subunit dehydrogenase
MRVKDSVVVVTGASSGIGRATALALAERGAAVVLVARRDEALDEVAAACRSLGAESLPAPAEVSDAEAVARVARRTAERLGRIDAWVNNAAVSQFAPFADAPMDEFRRVFEVNVLGHVHGARAALPYLRDQGTGVLVNVASVVGVVPQPYTTAYVMTKAAVLALSGSLRQELRLDGHRRVKVVDVLPAAIDTPIFEQAANHTGRRVLAMPPVYPAERVARAVVNQIRFPRRRVVVGTAGRALLAQSRLAPATTERLMARQVDRTHLSRRDGAPDSAGNLFDPAAGSGSIDGGWNGAHRTAIRRAASAGILVGAAAGASLVRSSIERR